MPQSLVKIICIEYLVPNTMSTSFFRLNKLRFMLTWEDYASVWNAIR
jgi:hypothetical protein